jgi:glycosyltransferase involved in cell wall biosynthesis
MLSLIILSYNDAPSLEENLPEWIRVMETFDTGYEIIIADDGSTDHTAELIRSYTASNRCIRYVRNERNKGVGANFRMGIAHASGDLIAYTDGDGQYVPADLRTLFDNLNGCDMVTGKRIRRADPFVRTITSKIYNRLVKLVYPVQVDDINSGLKLYRRAYIENCNPQISDGPFYDAEYLIKGGVKGMKIKEVPISHRPRKYGRPAGVSLKSVNFLFKEISRKDMHPFTRRNYFSRLIFRLLTMRSRLFLSRS